MANLNIKKEMVLTTKRQDRIFCFSALIFFVLHWLVFWLVANFTSIRLAFTYYDPIRGIHKLLPTANMFDNFKMFFNLVFVSNSHYVWNGVYFHSLSTFVCLPFSYMIAFIIYKKLPMTGLFKVLLYLPVILSTMITVLLYTHLIESGLDTVWSTFFDQDLPKLLTDLRYNRISVSIYVIFFGLPGSLLINLGSMSRIPNDLIEYGELEGISLWKEFCMITLPMMFSVLQVQCLGLFVGFFTAQGPLYAIFREGAPENLKTFGYHLFLMIYSSDKETTINKMANYGFTSAANLTIGLMSIPIIQLTKMLFDKLDPGAEF